MSRKFIPNGDADFAQMATIFAGAIQRDPAAFSIEQSECDLLVQQEAEFREARAVAKSPATRTRQAVSLKDKARARLEETVRRIANQVRANPRLGAEHKVLLGIRDRPKKLGKRTVPFAAPVLKYLGVPRKAGPNAGKHLLGFGETLESIGKSKPDGAVRVEIFVDLVADGAPYPTFPGQYLGGRPWYLRSFSRSPCKVQHPMPPVSMLVVYWARWADAHGNVGPFSETCRARTEGGWAIEGPTLHLEAAMDVKQLVNDPK